MRALKVPNRLLTKFEFIPLAVEASKVAVRSLNVADAPETRASFVERGSKQLGGQPLFSVFRTLTSSYDPSVARPLRIEYPNAIYHVMARSNG